MWTQIRQLLYSRSTTNKDLPCIRRHVFATTFNFLRKTRSNSELINQAFICECLFHAFSPRVTPYIDFPSRSMASGLWSRRFALPSCMTLRAGRTGQSWDTRISQPQKLPCLNALSDDILMEVFSYLDIEDIFSLRRVRVPSYPPLARAFFTCSRSANSTTTSPIKASSGKTFSNESGLMLPNGRHHIVIHLDT